MWTLPAILMPYSLKEIGWEPVRTHCCRKCFLVCWPPGLPGKEQILVTSVIYLSHSWAYFPGSALDSGQGSSP